MILLVYTFNFHNLCIVHLLSICFSIEIELILKYCLYVLAGPEAAEFILQQAEVATVVCSRDKVASVSLTVN